MTITTKKIDKDVIEITESKSATYNVSIKSIKHDIEILEEQLQEKKDLLNKLKQTK